MVGGSLSGILGSSVDVLPEIPAARDFTLPGRWEGAVVEHPGQSVLGEFELPDRTSALLLVRHLVLYGFPLVIAGPTGQRWRVQTWDGPYPCGALGRRTGEAVLDAATTLADRCDGRVEASTWFDAVDLAQRLADPSLLPRGPDDVVHIHPGSRPEPRRVVLHAAPPKAVLTLPADPAEPGTVDVSDLDTVDWANLEHGRMAAFPRRPPGRRPAR
jgi:hypothetical protein